LNVPLLKQNGYFKEISWQEAASLIAEKIALCNSQRFEISPHISLEEMLMLQRAADKYETKLCANPAFAYFSDSFLSLKTRK
jgi:anaerobic selenocysteine-containing dehydrogenase